MKKFLLALTLIVVPHLLLSGQPPLPSDINRYDDNGNRTGLWIEAGDLTSEYYYIDGKKDGIFKVYNGAGKLYVYGRYEKGSEVFYYIFGDDGRVLSLLDDFSSVEGGIVSGQTHISYPRKCHIIIYNPNGTKSDEGDLLFHTDPELDDTAPYGTWTFYDDQGRFIRSETFD